MVLCSPRGNPNENVSVLFLTHTYLCLNTHLYFSKDARVFNYTLDILINTSIIALNTHE